MSAVTAVRARLAVSDAGVDLAALAVDLRVPAGWVKGAADAIDGIPADPFWADHFGPSYLEGYQAATQDGGQGGLWR
jgi:hypothetical protein